MLDSGRLRNSDFTVIASAVTYVTPIPITPHSDHSKIPHRNFNLISSNARNSTKTNRNGSRFWNSVNYIIMKQYNEHDIRFAVDEVGEGVSIRRVAKN